MPKRGRGAVDRSENRAEIRLLLHNRWSPARISEHLLLKHGESIKPRTIEAYRQQHIVPAEVLPPQYLATHLAKRETLFDIMAELGETISLVKDRVKKLNDFDEGVGMPMPMASREIDLLRKLLVDYLHAGQDLGVFPVRSKEPVIPVGASTSIELNAEGAMDAVVVEQEMVDSGIQPQIAHRALLGAIFGRERVG